MILNYYIYYIILYIHYNIDINTHLCTVEFTAKMMQNRYSTRVRTVIATALLASGP